MSAVSPYLKQMLDMTGEEDHTVLDMPDSDHEVVQSLLDIVYNGSIEASLDMIRRLLTLAHSLYISVPVSDQLMSMLGLQLPPQPKLGPASSPASPKPQGPEFPFPGGLQAMSMWQQQILGQYAMMNGLLASGGQPPNSAAQETASKRMKTDSLMAHLPGASQGKELMAQHLNQIVLSAFRPENGTYVCSVCHSSYTNKGNFKQHIEKHFKNGEFPVTSNNNGVTNNGKIGSFGETFILADSVLFSWLVFFQSPPTARATRTSVTSATPPTATRATSSSTCSSTSGRSGACRGMTGATSATSSSPHSVCAVRESSDDIKYDQY